MPVDAYILLADVHILHVDLDTPHVGLDILPVDIPLVDLDILPVDLDILLVEVNIQRVDVDIRHEEKLADHSVTSAASEELPSRAVDQACHPFCPVQSCAGSACKHRPSKTPCQLYSSTHWKYLRVPRFQLSKQSRSIYTQFG